MPTPRAARPCPGCPRASPSLPVGFVLSRVRKLERSVCFRAWKVLPMEGPHIQIASTGARLPLLPEVTTVGRGKHVDIRLADPSVSLLHAEIVRRGPYVYVMDLGLSRNGTRVNGRLIARRVLCEGDAITFGSARCRIFGIDSDEEVGAEQYGSAAPELTRREIDVIASLCRPAMSENAFVAPAT